MLKYYLKALNWGRFQKYSLPCSTLLRRVEASWNELTRKRLGPLFYESFKNEQALQLRLLCFLLGMNPAFFAHYITAVQMTSWSG